MKYLIYVSSASELMSEDELEDLLKISRQKNQEKDITGMLLYGDGSFIQVLEGKEEDVESTFENIRKDNRHKNVIRILDGNLPARNFPDWTMGYMTVKKSDIDGFIDPTKDSFLHSGSVHPAVMVLKTFAETNKRYFNS